MIRKIWIVLALTLVHFGIVVALTYTGLHVVDATFAETGAPTLASKTVVWASKILYFPIVTLSFFPREMFPGSLVFVPILFNSFVWGACLYLAAIAVDRLRG